MTEDSDEEESPVPPLADLRIAFSGPQYSNTVSEMVTQEYKSAFELWQKLQQLHKLKVIFEFMTSSPFLN